MDRQMIVSHLDMARRHVALSREHVARQRALVSRLQRDGHDTATAEALLEEFEISLQLHEQGFAQITAELVAHDTAQHTK